MKHYLGISCEEYQNLDNISFCHSDSIKTSSNPYKVL